MYYFSQKDARQTVSVCFVIDVFWSFGKRVVPGLIYGNKPSERTSIWLSSARVKRLKAW